jgi:hypothetical protein
VGSSDDCTDEPQQVRSHKELFRTLVRAVAGTKTPDPLPLRLCRSFVEVLGAEGGAITLAYTDPERTTVCVTDGTADRVEDLQEVLGEGPGPDAYTTGSVVRATLPGDAAGRWPMLEKSIMSQSSPLTIHAFPMRVASDVLGVVSVYRRDADDLLMPDRDGQFLADALGAAIARQSAAEEGELSRWGSRDRLNQATGMVIAQLGITADDALSLIRAFAFSHDLQLGQVSQQIIERRQDFSANADFRGNEGL